MGDSAWSTIDSYWAMGVGLALELLNCMAVFTHKMIMMMVTEFVVGGGALKVVRADCLSGF